MKNIILSTLVIALMILYVVMPLDFMIGPFDDIAVVLAGLAARKRIATK